MAAKRVLIIAGKMHYGGIEMMIMNYYRNVDRSKIQFDFLLNYQETGVFDDEIKHLGGKIYILPRLFFRNTFKYIKALNRFFKTHKEYEVVHGHLTSVGVIYSMIAKRHGVKKVIIHAHSTSVNCTLKGFAERILMLPLRFCADYYFACSNKAGKYAFGKNILQRSNYMFIRNGIQSEKFVFNQEIRAKIRTQLQLEGKFVIGHIGRFEYEKNHGFIADLFGEIYKRYSDARLVFIGAGSRKDEIREKVRTMGLEAAVIFLEPRPDVNEIMQGMDVFLLPSHYEGLPVVGIEAQAAGLKCFFSDAVTRETDVTGLCSFIPLSRPANYWADMILKYKDSYVRSNMRQSIIDAGYDIREQAMWLQNFYLQ